MEISIEKTIEIFQGMKKGISPWYPEEYYNFAIDIMRKYQKIEQIKNDSLYDIYMAGVNMAGEYQGCWVRFKDIENIVNEHFSGGLDKNSQKLENQTTTNDLGVDCISRDDVRDVMQELWGTSGELMDRLMALPSVTPQELQTFKWCTGCKEHDQENHCCHRWSKVIRDTVEEIKQEYIEREVLDKIKEQIKSNLRGVEIALEVLVKNHPLRPKMEGAKNTLEECLELIDNAESEPQGSEG